LSTAGAGPEPVSLDIAGISEGDDGLRLVLGSTVTSPFTRAINICTYRSSIIC
jgi:hypothetical protein